MKRYIATLLALLFTLTALTSVVATASEQFETPPVAFSEDGRKCSLKLEYTKKTYTGSALKPKVTVKNTEGKTVPDTNYTVYYKNNKSVGKATVEVKFKGDYTGTKSTSFKIYPKGVSLKSLTAKSKSFTAKWSKRTSQTTGYQLRYSTASNLKGYKLVTVGKNSTVSKTVKKLKGKKKYYVQVRTYKKVSGTTYPSAWSTKKSVTTKK